VAQVGNRPRNEGRREITVQGFLDLPGVDSITLKARRGTVEVLFSAKIISFFVIN
jgi:hypothetical protein